MNFAKFTTATALAGTLAFAAAPAQSEEIKVLLDWYLNPDHAPLIVAEQIGAFEDVGLEVELIQPTDPSMPPRLLAAGKGDIAVSYQPSLYLLAEEELPVKRVATLVDTPLNTLAALKGSGIETIADFKGKSIGYSVSGVEMATLSVMLETEGLTLDDIELVNVNFQLVSGLLTGRVDGVIGGYRNFEATELRQQGAEGVMFLVEDHGVPMYDELIVLANAERAEEPWVADFVQALKMGTEYLRANPEETWTQFAEDYPDMNTELNETAWIDTLPMFADDPGMLDETRYIEYGEFLKANDLISQDVDVLEYAVETKVETATN